MDDDDEVRVVAVTDPEDLQLDSAIMGCDPAQDVAVAVRVASSGESGQQVRLADLVLAGTTGNFEPHSTSIPGMFVRL